VGRGAGQESRAIACFFFKGSRETRARKDGISKHFARLWSFDSRPAASTIFRTAMALDSNAAASADAVVDFSGDAFIADAQEVFDGLFEVDAVGQIRQLVDQRQFAVVARPQFHGTGDGFAVLALLS
jgi:hypothetical protein